jgi:hypothetical protein
VNQENFKEMLQYRVESLEREVERLMHRETRTYSQKALKQLMSEAPKLDVEKFSQVASKWSINFQKQFLFDARSYPLRELSATGTDGPIGEFLLCSLPRHENSPSSLTKVVFPVARIDAFPFTVRTFAPDPARRDAHAEVKQVNGWLHTSAFPFF